MHFVSHSELLFGLASAFITGLVSYQGVCYSFVSPSIFYSLLALVSQIKINITVRNIYLIVVLKNINYVDIT